MLKKQTISKFYKTVFGEKRRGRGLNGTAFLLAT
jgi:hypothetical protein